MSILVKNLSMEYDKMELNWQIRPRRTGRRVGLGSNDDAIKNAAKEEAKMNGIVSAREGRRQLGISHTG